MKSRLILFIHGLGGNGQRTWRTFSNLIKADARLPLENDIDYYNYPTSLVHLPFFSKSIKIQYLAAGLRTQINNEFSAYESITLVCHSLGGLIGRWYLMEEVKTQREVRVTHLLLYAVPNNGAQLASLAKYIFLTHSQLHQLCKKSDFIGFLNGEWDRLKMDNCVHIRYVLGGKDRIVDVESAQRIWGNDNIEFVSNKGHCNIVRPKPPNDMMAFHILKTFLSADLPTDEKDIPLGLTTNDRITNNNTKTMLAEELYRSCGASLDEININEELRITELHYGYSTQKECVRSCFKTRHASRFNSR
jgi:hypothetical protein